MISCIKKFHFCTGHRLHNHEGSCSNFHGHNYVAYIHVVSEELDAIGRVLDFADLKSKVGGWIDTHWDHGFIYSQDDRLAEEALNVLLPSGQKIFKMSGNPTAENMAEYLLRVVCPHVLGLDGLTATKVIIWETENCCAEASL